MAKCLLSIVLVLAWLTLRSVPGTNVITFLRNHFGSSIANHRSDIPIRRVHGKEKSKTLSYFGFTAEPRGEPNPPHHSVSLEGKTRPACQPG